MKKKRTFSPLGLRVSSRYVYPARRRRWLGLGLLLAAAALLWAALDFFFLDAAFLSSGPLSSQHAGQGSDCAACHALANATPSAKCASCHESGEGIAEASAPDAGNSGPQLALYGYPAHFAYLSDDLRRSGDSALEEDCSHCHSEHQGRGFSLTSVDDSRCASCHGFSSLADGHPEFLASRGGLARVQEQGGLKFPHAVHVNKVLPDERKLQGQAACLFCHRPEEGGEGFGPLSFELHCGEGCHLNKASPLLPLARDGISGSGGVLAPEDLRRADPAAPCLPSIDAASFRRVPPGDPRRIRLQVIGHQDCWIEENLRILRRSRHADLGLADLLAERAPEEFDSGLLRQRYADAAEVLSARLVRLRQLERAESPDGSDGSDGSGGGQGQASSSLDPALRRGGEAESRLRQAAALLPRPGAVGPLSLLAAPSHEPLNRLDQLLSQTFQDLSQGGYLPQPAFQSVSAQLIRDLTQPCRECHDSSPLGLAPVQDDQKTLKRARFDHSAHLVQMQCADCHASVTTAQDDRGEMLHLPSIETCRGCHNPSMSSDDCATCHYFHPHKERRAWLLSSRPVSGEDGRE